MTSKITNLDKALVPNQSDAQQSLSVTSAAVFEFQPFDDQTSYIQLYIHSDVGVRFDGVDPTSTATDQMVLKAGTAPIWKKATADMAKFRAASGTSVITAQGFAE